MSRTVDYTFSDELIDRALREESFVVLVLTFNPKASKAFATTGTMPPRHAERMHEAFKDNEPFTVNSHYPDKT